MAHVEIAGFPPTLFAEHTQQVVERLRTAVEAVLHAVPDLREARPVELAAGLKLDPKLAWKITRLLEDLDPFAAAQFVPGTTAFRIFLRAAARRGVPRPLLAAARAAFDSFGELIKIHAGERGAFELMLAGHAQTDRAPLHLVHRKQTFLGNSYVWGLQSRLILRTDILAPSPGVPMFDVAIIRGHIDLRRLRPNVPWRIARGQSTDDAGVVHSTFERQPLEPEYDPGFELRDLPLMPEFCSRPLPTCRRVDNPGGSIDYELVEGSVGNTGLLTCITGELMRRVEPRYRTAQYHDVTQLVRMRTPCELLHFDVLIARDFFGRRIEPAVAVFSDLFADYMSMRYRSCDRLPVQERIEYLGMGLDSLATPDIPQYHEMVECAFERAGWNASDFDVFRLRMKYPPIPTSIAITHDLPDPPRGGDERTAHLAPPASAGA